MQVLKPKGRPGGLETWAPLGFSYEPIEKGNLLFPGAAPSAPAETQKKPRGQKPRDAHGLPADTVRPKTETHPSGSGGKTAKLPMYLTYPSSGGRPGRASQ